jgi:hypothetical protein
MEPALCDAAPRAGATGYQGPMDTPGQTAHMLASLDRMQAGDRVARDELLRGFGDRLERLARKMLRRFPSVGRWVETEDVLQNSLEPSVPDRQYQEPFRCLIYSSGEQVPRTQALLHPALNCRAPGGPA